MTFDLEVRFSGLCHFIPNNSMEDREVKMCVALPDAPGHESRIEVGLGTAKDCVTNVAVESIKIRFHRVFWVVETLTPAKQPLTWQEVTAGGDHLGIPMEKLAPSFADDDLAVVGAKRAPFVRAQVLLDRGHLSPESSGPRAKWRLPRIGKEAPEPISVRNSAVLSIQGIEKAKMVLANFDGTVQQQFCFEPKGNRVHLFLSNDCAKTAQFPLPVRAEDLKGTVDLDFFFHYGLLNQGNFAALSQPAVNVPYPQLVGVEGFQEALSDLRSGRVLSREEQIRLELLEIKEKKGITAGSGCNCLGALGKARSFDLDRFLSTT